MAPQTWTQAVKMHILLDNSGSNGNQKMKFVQLEWNRIGQNKYRIDYIVRNTSLQKTCRKLGREISSRHL